MITDDIKQLLGEDTISEETALKLQELFETVLATRLQEEKEKEDKEKDDEKDKKDLEEDDDNESDDDDDSEDKDKDKEKDLDESDDLKAKDKEIEDLKQESEDKDKEIEDLKKDKEEIQEKANAYIEEMKSLIEERIQSSVDAAIVEFVNENKQMFEQLDQFNRMQDAFKLVQEAFETNGFVLNENIALENAKKEIDNTTSLYDDLFEKFETVEKELQETKTNLVFLEQTKDLTESQKEKVAKLAEDVSYEGSEEYSKVLSLLIEQVSQGTKNTGEEKGNDHKNVSPQMKKWLDGFK